MRATVPGKLMLCGEYSVCRDGGDALAAAVDAYFEVTFQPSGTDFRVSSAGMGLEDAPISSVPVLESVVGYAPASLRGGAFVVHTRVPQGDRKPGVGSSAAICVAGMAAMKAQVGQRLSLADAIAAHQRAQGGKGSGYDVATCMTGGVTHFSASNTRPEARRLQWLQGLHAAIFFTGRGSDTAAQLRRVEQARWHRAQNHEEQLAHMGATAARFCAYWGDGDLAGVLRSAREAETQLKAFGTSGQLDIHGGGVGELVALVNSAGAVGRTSGAGGGDCVWALAEDAQAIAVARELAVRHGYRVLELEVVDTGLVLKETV